MDPLLFIPGPVEISPSVRQAAAEPPLAHGSTTFVELFGELVRRMREIWRAGPEFQPFAFAGSGTLAMETAACNLLDPGQTALVVQTGIFGERMSRILERRGVHVVRVTADAGEAPTIARIAEVLDDEPVHALFATHVDTSTAVRLDVRSLAELARKKDVLFVLDGVCAIGGELCDQAGWGIDVVLAASQKALGGPPGLSLLVASPRALEARRGLRAPPPLAIDLEEWLPVHHALEGGLPSYFATPPTSLVRATVAALREIDIRDAVARQARVGAAMHSAWRALRLASVPAEGDAAHTLSALWIPEQVRTTLPQRLASLGVLVAGPLHPSLKPRSFRVGHMGYVTRRRDLLERCVRILGRVLVDEGHPADVEGAVSALHRELPESEREVDRHRLAARPY
jgi:alanine-glyoxylate transaminase/serine-glyoxylate transaminase/serine-pyruvate transaminase